LLSNTTTTVKVEAEAKARLEELQAKIRLEAGKKVTQQELLSRVIDGAHESGADVVESFRESTVPLTDEQKEAMRGGQFASGVETDEEDIDDILYG